ncbi:hypothetical protein [Planomonospora sp. ID82291]|uniref:hypothetical protein n=1 Tax=Planomonospora sp. ID82291 TaxID=2738136 RepID=UPI0018C3C629|nr:hypothetical protein [Planomonospora sp. ID82291]MBG0818892.1 hypothetical protein [Planomonospora sp. ID82291]
MYEALAKEVRTAATTLREMAAAAREATTPGPGDDWRPWYVVQETQPDPAQPLVTTPSPWGPMTGPALTRTGQAAPAHHRFAHDHGEAWYESEFIGGMMDARVAEWIVLTSPALAEPFADLLDYFAGRMLVCQVEEAHFGEGEKRRSLVKDARGTTYPDLRMALELARFINRAAEDQR